MEISLDRYIRKYSEHETLSELEKLIKRTVGKRWYYEMESKRFFHGYKTRNDDIVHSMYNIGGITLSFCYSTSDPLKLYLSIEDGDSVLVKNKRQFKEAIQLAVCKPPF